MAKDSFSDRFGTSGYPVFVRKLDKKSVWGHVSDDIGDRIPRVSSDVFSENENRFSLYSVTSDDELMRVVIGLNSFRRRLNDQMDLVAFTRAEIEEAGIVVVETPGNTECESANRLHVDIHAADHTAYYQLCESAITRQRPAFRVSKSEAKSIARQLNVFGCHAFDGNDACPCVDV